MKPEAILRLIVSTLLLIGLMSVGAQAASTKKSAGPFQSGFYFGGSFGMSLLNGDHEDCENLDGKYYTNNTTSINEIGMQFGGHAGYLHRFESSDFAVALEPFAKYLGMKSSVKDYNTVDEDLYNYESSLSMPWELGANLKFGCILEDVFVYGIFGVALAKMEYEKTENGSLLVKDEKRALGFTYGLGIEKEMSNSHRIGLEITQTRFGSQRFSSTDRDGQAHTMDISPNITSLVLRYSIPF